MNNIKKNIRHLLKVRGVCIGDFERGYGVTVGRLSRPTELPLDLVYIMAKDLEVPLEVLIEHDLEKEAEIEKIEREIERLSEKLAELKGGGSDD